MVGVAGLGLLLGASVVKGQTGAVNVDSAKATYKELVPGVSVVVAWGDMDKGPYGAFIKFVPGHSDGLHTHTNGSRSTSPRTARSSDRHATGPRVSS